uniref:Uncharacterized protein n=1 Tax=Sphaerodactylus townsendi TaxID=933632 RepID=A0ACB8FFN7_9SAUR
MPGPSPAAGPSLLHRQEAARPARLPDASAPSWCAWVMAPSWPASRISGSRGVRGAESRRPVAPGGSPLSALRLQSPGRGGARIPAAAAAEPPQPPAEELPASPVRRHGESLLRPVRRRPAGSAVPGQPEPCGAAGRAEEDGGGKSGRGGSAGELQFPDFLEFCTSLNSVLASHHCQSAEPSPGSGPCSSPNTGSGFINSSQQALLNQQLKQQLLLHHQQQQQQQQQQILTEAEKISPQDQMNRHLTRPPPDYKDQRRNQVSIQQTHQYSGGSPAMSISSNMCFSNPVSTPSISQQASTILSAAHGARMPSHQAARHVGCYGNIPCSQPSTYTTTTTGVSQVPQHRNPNQIIPSPSSSAVSRQAPPGQGNNLSSFESGSGINSQPGKLSLNPGTSGQRPLNVMVTSSSAIQNWVSQETGGKLQDARKAAGPHFPVGSPYPNQPLQRAVTHQQFPQRATVPPNPLGAVQARSPANHSLNGQVVGAQKALSARSNQVRAQAVPHLNPPGPNVTTANPLLSSPFQTSPHQTTARAFQGTDPANDLAFDFLNQPGDNIGPALNSDSDFIDSLLKTEPGNDDWMKDINLDEILGGHS